MPEKASYCKQFFQCAESNPQGRDKAQVSSMVHAGLGHHSGAKLIEQRRMDFTPAEASTDDRFFQV